MDTTYQIIQKMYEQLKQEGSQVLIPDMAYHLENIYLELSREDPCLDRYTFFWMIERLMTQGYSWQEACALLDLSRDDPFL